MENKDHHKELTNEEKIGAVVNIAGCIGTIATSLYAIILICKRRATRCNWSLLAITILCMLYTITGTTLVLSDFLIQLSLKQIHELLIVNACSQLMSHWIFQAMLLKAACILPLIFIEDEMN